MNEIEKAIEMHHRLTDNLNGDTLTKYRETVLQALQAQAERDKMRCENCNNCEQGETVYDRYCVELEKNCYTMKFCSEFKLKENTP